MWSESVSCSVAPTLCDPMDCSPPGSSVHEIFFLARILEGVAISFSRGSSQPRDRTWVSCIAGEFFTISITREAQLGLKTSLSNSHFPSLRRSTSPNTQLCSYSHWGIPFLYALALFFSKKQLPGGPGAKTQCSQCRSIWSHMPQLKIKDSKCCN